MLRNIVLISVFFIFYAFAGDRSRIATEIQTLPFQQQIVMGNLDLNGYAPAISSSLSNLAGSNPALLAVYNKMGFGISYQYDSKIGKLSPYIDLSQERENLYLPQSFAFVFPYNNWVFGAGFSQEVNSNLIFPPLPVTTVENPDGTGEYMTVSYQRMIMNYALQIAYNYNFSTSTNLGFGLQLNGDHLFLEDKVWHTTLKVKDLGFSGKIGFVLDYENKFGFGIYFKKGTDISTNGKLNKNLLVQIDLDTNNTGNNSVIRAIQPGYRIVTKTPDQLQFGIRYTALENLDLDLNINQVYWKNISSNYRNTTNFATNLVFKINENFSLTGGYLRDYDRNAQVLDQYFNSVNSDGRAEYILAGLQFKTESYRVGIISANTISATGNLQDQSIFKLSFDTSL